MHTTRRLTLLLIPILLLAIPFLIFPLFGLRAAGEMEMELVKNQENHLSELARSLSEQISGQIKPAPPPRKELPQKQPVPKPTYSRLSGTMRLDGLNNDWPPELLSSRLQYGNSSENLSYRYYSGIQGQYLYLLFEVQDDHVIYRATDTLKLDESDHLQIVVYTKTGQKKYIAAGYKPGWIVGFEIPDDPLQIAQIEKRIHGVWKSTDNGYALEVRIDRALLGEHYSFAIADVDDREIRSITAVLDTSYSPKQPEPEPEAPEPVDMSKILDATDPVPASYRVRIIGKDLQILAESGTLSGLSDAQATTGAMGTIPDLDGIQQALKGQQTLVDYRSPNMPDEITAAIAPVRNEDEVVALVAVEQNMNVLLSPIKGSINESILLFVTTFLLSCGGICLYLFWLTRSGNTKSV